MLECGLRRYGLDHLEPVMSKDRAEDIAASAVVFDHQKGCLKYSYFSGDADVLPPNHACVHGDEARLVFTSTWFADPGYAQISRTSDIRILTRGPGDDTMGATNFLLEAHKWTKLQIRLREFMPVGIRPLVVTVT